MRICAQHLAVADFCNPRFGRSVAAAELRAVSLLEEANSMKCMHCLVAFHTNQKTTIIGEDTDGGWAILRLDCPECGKMNLFLLNCELRTSQSMGYDIGTVYSATPIRPRGSNRPPCPPEVPQFIAEDYREACLVLPDSPKASAALSRRCLQNLLREAAKVKHGNLADEIQAVIDKGHLPSDLIQMIDAVRQIGNFAAHPLKSTSTGEILPVEPQEAEWNLDVLEELFDFYYVRPAIIAKKRAELNEKLKEAGRPPMK